MVDTVNIINLHTVNIKKWIKEPNNIYIGRRTKECKPSKWRNPFKITRRKSRRKVVRLFDKYLQRNKKLANSIPELKDKVLGCWCAPKRCHGQVLHRRAGNKSVYQSRIPAKNSHKRSIMESESFLQHQLDQQLTNVLQAINEALKNGENNGKKR